MAVFPLCKGDDPVLHELFKVYGANILRVPEGRVQPLFVVARKDRKHHFQGKLAPLLTGAALPRMKPEESPMAEVSGKRTRKVEAALGLEILGGLLSGLGVRSPGVTAEFSVAREISFSIGEVTRLWIDTGLLGRKLEGRVVDRKNPSAGLFFGDDPWDMLVIESVIASARFTARVERARKAAAKLDIPAIEGLVAKVKADVEVSAESETAVTFRGPKALTFAFSCLRLFVEPDGRIALVNPQDTFLNAAVSRGDVVYIPDRVRLAHEPAMIAWDPGQGTGAKRRALDKRRRAA